MTARSSAEVAARKALTTTLLGCLTTGFAFCLLAVVFAAPPVSELGSQLPGDTGDPVLNTYFLAWGAHFFSGEAQDFWSANFFWPTERPMLRSDHMLGPAFFHFLVTKMTGAGPILSYNLLFLLAFAVTGWTTCLVLRAAGLSWLAAFFGGLCFSFAPARWDQTPHLQVLLAPALAPALWWFHRFLQNGRLRTGLLFVSAYAVQMLCGNYLAYFMNLALLALVTHHLIRQGRTLLTGRRLIAAFAIASLCAGIAVPIYGPYVLHGPQELERQPEEVSPLSASVSSFLTANPTSSRYPKWMTRRYRAENGLFPGSVVLALGAVALFARVRFLPLRRRAWDSGAASLGRRTLAAKNARLGLLLLGLGIAIALAGFSLGDIYTLHLDRAFSKHGWIVGAIHDPSYRRPLRIFLAGALLVAFGSRLATGSLWPLRFRPRTPDWHRALVPVALVGSILSFAVFEMTLREVLPGLSGLRAINRASILTMLALSAFAALSLDDLRSCLRRWVGSVVGATVSTLLIVLLAIELRPRIGWVTPLDPADTAALGRYLEDHDDVRAIAEFPTGRFPQSQAQIMYRSTNHWKPMVNGYSGTIPALTRDLLEATRVPNVTTTERMRGVGVSHILVSEFGRGYSPAVWRRVLDRFDRQVQDLGLEHEITLDGFRVYRISSNGTQKVTEGPARLPGGTP